MEGAAFVREANAEFAVREAVSRLMSTRGQQEPVCTP